MLASSGEITAPCAVPCSLMLTIPSSSTPAFSHLRIRRMMRLSPTRCSTKRISQSWLTVSKNERRSASMMKLTLRRSIPTTNAAIASCAPRPGHACPARRPGRALLARIPLGPGPWLHQLRSRSLHLVRRLLSYYDRVRFPASVHHRLRLLAFPMRTIDLIGRWSDAGPPRFRRDPFARDVVFDPGRTTGPCIAALLMLRSTMETVSAPAICPFRGSIHTPRNSCVRFVAGVAAGLTQHSLPGGSLRLTWAGLPPADRASFLAHLHPGYSESGGASRRC